jgi:hypothetical protein
MQTGMVKSTKIDLQNHSCLQLYISVQKGSVKIKLFGKAY